ncbi:MAG: stage II sporulation protein M [Patescibacteria group bacterium]
MAALHEFYRRNRPNWERLETILGRAGSRGLASLDRQDLLSLGRLYRQAASNLAYARTHRLEPDLIAYLNGLVGRAHAYIYVSPAGTLRRIGLFFRRTFPAVLQKRLGFILLAFLIMLGAAAFGLCLQLLAPKAAAVLVPPGRSAELYKRFEENTWFNDPLAERPLISGAIMANNIWVSVMAFAGGILLGLLTFQVLYGNGLLLGVLTGVFIRHGHGFDFWATILPHGVIELTAIAIAGGAGLLLASALINPGRYRRRDALVIRGRDAVVLLLGVACLLVAAGAIEGFVSTIGRLGNAPRLLIAGATALLLYPYLLWPRKGPQEALERDGLLALAGEEGLP